jgi:hypothetical protein
MIAGQADGAMIDFKGSHFERDVILWGVRWYVAYPMSYRQLEEMMEERGVEVDHSTLNRWVIKYAPLREKQFRARKRSMALSLFSAELKAKLAAEFDSAASRRASERALTASPTTPIAARISIATSGRVALV